MIPLDRLVLLDTAIVVHLVRGKDLGHLIEKRYVLRSRPERPLISIVTVGELLSFVERRGWGEAKKERLEDLLSELVIVDIHSRPVLEAFARLKVYSERAGRTIGDNDLWIAATTAATEAWLLTADKDFDHLHPDFLHREWVDPELR